MPHLEVIMPVLRTAIAKPMREDLKRHRLRRTISRLAGDCEGSDSSYVPSQQPKGLQQLMQQAERERILSPKCAHSPMSGVLETAGRAIRKLLQGPP